MSLTLIFFSFWLQDELMDAGYRADLSHQSIEELVAEKKALESRVRPIMDTLASYHNLPVVRNANVCMPTNRLLLSIKQADHTVPHVFRST